MRHIEADPLAECYEFSMTCVDDWITAGRPLAPLGAVWILLAKAMLLSEGAPGTVASLLRHLADEVEKPDASVALTGKTQ